MNAQPTARVAAVNRGVEQTDLPASVRGPEHDLLEIWVGKWINEGSTVGDSDTPAARITTSDVYEWLPGRFFVLHTAYGKIGDLGVGGGAEIIGYDRTAGCYRSHFFDSQGNASIHTLTATGDTWTYQGENTRATVVFSDGGRVQTVRHERTDDGRTYAPSMNVVLTRVE